MTIASQTSRISYTGDGATTIFAVPFYFSANSDLVVVVQDAAGAVTTKTLGTDYNLSGATLSAGGSCTFGTAPTAGFIIAIYRDPPVTQTTSYNNNDPFPAKSHEAALDKLTTLIQRMVSRLGRTVSLFDTSSYSNLTLPDPLAGTFLRWNTALTGLENSSLGGIPGSPGNQLSYGTQTLVAADTILATVLFVRTAGYSNVGDGGGAFYKRVASMPSHLGRIRSLDRFLPNGTVSAGNGGWWEISESQPNVLMFGATAADLYTGGQAALDYLAAITGPRNMRFPGGTYALATKLTCSADNATLILDNDCTINHNTSDYFALLMTGQNQTVRGGRAGGFVGPSFVTPPSIIPWAVSDAGGVGADPAARCVIKFTGQFPKMDGVRVFNINRCGVVFKDGNNATMINCLIDGQQAMPVYPLILTVHFGVHFDNSTEASLGNFHCHNNTIRYCTQGAVFANYGSGDINAHGVNCTSNIFENIWDHAIYSNYTDGMVCTGNSFSKCHLAVASSGPRNIIVGNTFDPGALIGGTDERACSGVSLRDPTYCIVANNTFFGNPTVNSGICIDLGCFNVSLEQNIIANNTIRTVTAGCPIRITNRSLGFTLINNIVEGNSIYGLGRQDEALIQIEGYVGGGNTGNIIRGNRISMLSAVAGHSINGIGLNYCSDGLVCDNVISLECNSAALASIKGVALESCADIKLSNNLFLIPAGQGGNIGMVGIAEHGGTSLRNESRFNRVANHSVAAGLTYTDIVVDTAASKMLVFYEGTGAPTVPARTGSQYTRLDGGAGTSFYVNQADGNFWAGK